MSATTEAFENYQVITNETGRVFRVGEEPRTILGYGRWVPITAAWLAMCLAGLLEYTWGALNPSLSAVHHWSPAPVFWAFEDVEDHWDKLILRSFITAGGNRQLYQEGTLDKMLAPKDLIRRYTGGDHLAEGTVLFGGTFGAIGGIRSAPRFDFEIVDDVIGRKISHGYDILSLPIAG